MKLLGPHTTFRHWRLESSLVSSRLRGRQGTPVPKHQRRDRQGCPQTNSWDGSQTCHQAVVVRGRCCGRDRMASGL